MQLTPPGAADGWSADADGSGASSGASSRSGGSGRGKGGVVHLELRGPFQFVELEGVSRGRVVAPHTHAAWLVLLTVVGWGCTSQLHGRAGWL